MFNNQEVGLGNDVGFNNLGVKDHDDNMINGLKWSHLEQFDHDHDIHLQIVPNLHQDHEKLEIGYESLLVPDEHSETGDHRCHHNQQYHHDHSYYSNHHNKQLKRRRCSPISMSSSDEESSDLGYTREVPSMTRKICKKRRRRVPRKEMMSHKMLKLQQLLPNFHKRDEISVLDNAIDYMKDLRLQIQVMSMMGINPYMTSPYGMHNYLSTALTMSHGQIPMNQATSSPFIPPLNWPLTPINLSSYSSSPLGFVPCFPSFMDHIRRV